MTRKSLLERRVDLLNRSQRKQRATLRLRQTLYGVSYETVRRVIQAARAEVKSS